MLGLTITRVGMGLGRFPEGCKPIEFCVIERAEGRPVLTVSHYPLKSLFCGFLEMSQSSNP